MALTTEEQEFYDWAAQSLPAWFTNNRTALEELMAYAKMFGAVRTHMKFWFDMSLIGNAYDEAPPDWLNQHAKDRNTTRQSGETDVQLRERLLSFETSVTPDALLTLVNDELVANGHPGTAVMVELRRDRAFFGTYTSESGTGGEFTGTAPDMIFTPDVPYQALLREGTLPKRGHLASLELTISGAATGGNDGTFAITGQDTDGAEYTNGSGVAQVDATVSWTLVKNDLDGNDLDGFGRAYMSRGYRMSKQKANGFVIILPYDSPAISASLKASITELIRQKKPAGFTAIIEQRLIP